MRRTPTVVVAANSASASLLTNSNGKNLSTGPPTKNLMAAESARDKIETNNPVSEE
jgi:hypothetical protein